MLWPTPNQSPAPGRPFHLEPSRRNNSPTSHSPPTTSSSRSSRSPHELRTFLARYSGVSPPAVRSPSPAVPVLPLSTSGPGQPLTEAESDTMAVHPTWLTPPPSSDCHESVRTRNHKVLRYLWTPVAPLTLPPRRIPRLATVENLIESQRGKLTINGITPKMLSDWEARYPSVREADHINYEYDGSTSRMIIRCHVSPVHDSLQIYFKGRASVALIARLGDESFLENIQMSSGSSFGGFTGKYNAKSHKQPDAFLQVDGCPFPSVVCEAGWAEKMPDLIRDAELWLLHTGGHTSVVIVVAFTEEFCPPEPEPPVDVPEPTSDPEAENFTADSASDTSSSLSDPPTEEDILLSSITSTTTPRDLAGRFLALHRLQQLDKPLVGNITATIHVFRRDTAGTGIEATYSATLLPAPADSADQSFSLTMGEVLGELAAEEGVDVAERIEFPLEPLRRLVGKQKMKFEVVRAMDRTEAVMKGLGIWEEGETFAQSKKRKREHGGVEKLLGQV